MVNKEDNPLIFKALNKLLISNYCLFCNRQGCSGKICDHCLSLFQPSLPGKSCIRCAIPLNVDSISTNLECGECQQEPPNFNRCVATYLYNPASAKLVNALKHHGQLSTVPIIAEMMHSSLKKRFINQDLSKLADLIIPVPLHGKSISVRGFNHTNEIAKILSKRLQIPLDNHSCKRIKNTKPQQNLSRNQRKKNLLNAFNCDHSVTGKRIALIDDVVTTGSTANEVAKTLLNAGALTVEIWCFVRTP